MESNGKEFNLEDMIGKGIKIIGAAHNAKAGAVMMTDDDEVIYVRGRQEWPDEMIGNRIEIEGILTKGKVYPEVTIDEGGGISQGISGDQYAIELQDYRTVPD